jgi:hypothetical protein
METLSNIGQVLASIGGLAVLFGVAALICSFCHNVIETTKMDRERHEYRKINQKL